MTVFVVTVLGGVQASCGRSASSYGRKVSRRTSGNGGTGSTSSCCRCICARSRCVWSLSFIRWTSSVTDHTRSRALCGPRTIRPSCPRASSPSPTCSVSRALSSSSKQTHSSARCRSRSAVCWSTSASSSSSSSWSSHPSRVVSISSTTTIRRRRRSLARWPLRQRRRSVSARMRLCTGQRPEPLPATSLWLPTSRTPSIRKSSSFAYTWIYIYLDMSFRLVYDSVA